MISQTAEYALRAVVVLGSQPARPMTTREVARASRVPGGYLSKVLQSLGRAGLVEARRGLRGGYVLSRALDQITVYDVVNAVDPLKRILHCPLGLSAHAQQLCSLHRRLDAAVAMIETYFRETTIAALLNDRSSPLPGPLCDLTEVAGPPVCDGPIVTIT
jgi:Rrf2 family nitric oxide-sensitive transcriptional repressor